MPWPDWDPGLDSGDMPLKQSAARDLGVGLRVWASAFTAPLPSPSPSSVSGRPLLSFCRVRQAGMAPPRVRHGPSSWGTPAVPRFSESKCADPFHNDVDVLRRNASSTGKGRGGGVWPGGERPFSSELGHGPPAPVWVPLVTVFAPVPTPALLQKPVLYPEHPPCVPLLRVNRCPVPVKAPKPASSTDRRLRIAARARD